MDWHFYRQLKNKNTVNDKGHRRKQESWHSLKTPAFIIIYFGDSKPLQPQDTRVQTFVNRAPHGRHEMSFCKGQRAILVEEKIN